MTATVIIEQIYNTAPGTFIYKDNSGTEKSGSRYMTTDNFDGSLTTHPIPIPTADNGISGSYWITHCIDCTVAPDTYLKNLRYYQTWSVDPVTDWSLGSSVANAGRIGPGLYIGISSATVADAKILTQGFPSGSYEQAAGNEGTSGYYISNSANGYDYYTNCSAPASGGMVSITHFDSLGNAFMVQSGQIVGASTGRSYCIVTQVLVGSGATAGEKADKTATFVYSES